GAATGARNHSLTFMVGGDPQVLEFCRPVLETTAGQIFVMGGVGSAALTKNVQNMMQALNLIAAGEGFRLMQSSGVDMEVFQEVVRHTGAQSLVGDAYLHQWGLRPVPWVYSLETEYALDVAQSYGIELPLAAAGIEIMGPSDRT